MLIKSINDLKPFSIYKYINAQNTPVEKIPFAPDHKDLFKIGPIYYRNIFNGIISVSNDFNLEGDKKIIIKSDFVVLLLKYLYMKNINLYLYQSSMIFKIELSYINIGYIPHKINRNKYKSDFKLNDILCSSRLLRKYGGDYFKRFFKEEKADFLYIDLRYEGEDINKTNYMSYILEYIYTGDLSYIEEQILLDLYDLAVYMGITNMVKLLTQKIIECRNKIHFIYDKQPELWN